MIISIKNMLGHPRILALLDQAVVSGGNFLTLLYIGRRLAAEDFGLFSLAMMGILFLANLHRAMLTQPLNILGAAEAPERLAARLAALLRAHVLVIPIAAAALTLLSLRFFPQTALLFGCICYAACFFPQEMVRRYCYTQERTDLALLNDLISYGGQILVLLIAGLLWPIDGPTAFIIMALTSLLACWLGLRKIALPPRAATPSMRSILAQHWKMSSWLIPTVLAVWGASQIYPFLIAGLGPVAVAGFAAARNLLNASGVVVQSLGNYLPVRATVLLRQQGKAALRRHLLQTLTHLTLASLPVVLAMLLFAKPLLHLVYGGTYDAAAPLLRVMALGTLFSLLGAVLGAYSLAMEDTRASFLANLGASAVTFSAGLWLIRDQGVEGAAIASSLSAAAAMALQGMFVIARLNTLPAGGKVHA